MRHVTANGTSHVYILANDDKVKEVIMSFLDGLMKISPDRSFIFVGYHVQNGVMLLHFKPLEHDTDFDSALKLVEDDISKGKIHGNDNMLKKALRAPQATTGQELLDYIRRDKK